MTGMERCLAGYQSEPADPSAYLKRLPETPALRIHHPNMQMNSMKIASQKKL